MAWQQPKTNWDTHPKAIEPADMNRIEGNILAVREQISIPLRVEVVDNFPPHTAGRIIYHTGNNKAYVSNGTEWLPIGIEGNAEAGHVLAGKIFSSQVAGAGIVGTMPNRGAHDIMPGVTDITIPAGYHNGSGVVKADTRRAIYASSTVRISADTERTVVGNQPTKVKEIKIGRPGTCRLRFDAKGYMEAGFDTYYSQIRINDQIIETFEASFGNYYTRTLDLKVEAGDLIQLYGRYRVSDGVYYCRNFRVCYDYVLNTTEDEVLLD